jgi:histidine triad (HIT) family protein
LTETCLFCRMARGEIPVHEVHRDEAVLAFLDIGPISEGHVLIIPLEHHDTFETLPADLMARITGLGQRLARALKVVSGVDRVGFMFTGGDVAHAHAHVVPLTTRHTITSIAYIEQQDLTFRLPPNPGNEVLAGIATRLKAALD